MNLKNISLRHLSCKILFYSSTHLFTHSCLGILQGTCTRMANKNSVPMSYMAHIEEQHRRIANSAFGQVWEFETQSASSLYRLTTCVLMNLISSSLKLYLFIYLGLFEGSYDSLLALCSEITPIRAWGTKCNVRD